MIFYRKYILTFNRFKFYLAKYLGNFNPILASDSWPGHNHTTAWVELDE